MRQLLAVRANLNFGAFQSALDDGFVGDECAIPGQRLDLANRSRARGLRQAVFHRLRQRIDRDLFFDLDDIAL